MKEITTKKSYALNSFFLMAMDFTIRASHQFDKRLHSEDTYDSTAVKTLCLF